MNNKEMEARIVAAYERHKTVNIGARPGVKNRLGVQCNELTPLLAPLTSNNGEQLTPDTLARYSIVLMRYMNTLDTNGRRVDLNKKNIDWYIDGLISEGKKGLIAKSFLRHQIFTFRALLKHLGREEEARSLRRLETALQMMTAARKKEILARRKEREREGSFKKGRRSVT
ncbi:hypothetical protein MD588_00900 [Photobacterium sp. SDRW27]|uniref:hypothetical protein n=1 Tax=Photobacterium obscurum TaxID=2829490 RepID=UPI00224394E1|nr:hypothetical protein [Photobacterium obscurum]MCW8327358.1 hypothetical protein [Photobacterium obscurum]